MLALIGNFALFLSLFFAVCRPNSKLKNQSKIGVALVKNLEISLLMKVLYGLAMNVKSQSLVELIDHNLKKFLLEKEIKLLSLKILDSTLLNQYRH